jgi:hypothetical protein
VPRYWSPPWERSRPASEAIAPKYDCVPSASPAIQYDPYYTQVVQWPDRVVIRYEKDDQTRTIWLDGRKPTVQDYSLQGFSVGRYDGNAPTRPERSS